MAEESAVKVCVRIRPLLAREENAGSENSEPVQLFWKADEKSIHQLDDGSSSRSFSFDRVFTADETTNQLYQTIAKPLVVSTVGGYNGTVFAYGQTSSGKTFTMMGSDRSPGVIPLAVEEVFQTIKNHPKKEFLLRVSYMEIYNETVTDLLVDSRKRKPLEVRETINKNICVADLTEELVTSPAQALAWIRKGEKNRHYAKTKMNQRSSRSHAIFRMILESREMSDPASGDIADGAIIVSHLNLVDLAGSERASQTGAEGARFKEGCNINRSLFMLGQVIKKVTDESQKGFTNYRDSKLTRILQNSLGGNAKTVIICTITPATLEETLSTLQFASTAKKMKNDPHVTEVSDDGALLKRYRNEIVELKQRLQEVSSVTQTTATEKEVLSQLLQEKDQLQREQEDRIKNLTKLLVTSSNFVPVQKMPKRRMTWGGKMLKLAHLAACDDDEDDVVSDLSFAGPFSQKMRIHSCLTELSEADENFDSQWEIPEEPPDQMETSDGSVTTRSFGDSSREYVSREQAFELSQKVSNLELQLEVEIQQREEAIKKTETLDTRLAELQLQLQTETLQKQEGIEKMQSAELKVAELERQLQEQSQDGSKQMKREFAETIQLCETLVSEKDAVFAERDYLKQELGMFMEQIQHLEKEKAALSQELKEKSELDEFESLEDRFSKELENELHNKICSLKQAVKSSEAQCLELQSTLQTLSEELKQKTEFAEELQRMNNKDLMQEVVNLRRSLEDSEGVSRDTKKEWAFLRSENISLEELNVTLSSKQEKMEAETTSLLSQLETEKSRFKKMQSDLQKELNVTFEENTKLTSLLNGKVPKNLIDSMELERTVTRLEKELMASQVQVCDLTEELQSVKNQRDDLLSGQTLSELDAQQLRDSLQTSKEETMKIQADLNVSAQREEELRQRCSDVTQQLDSLHSELKQSGEERSQLVAFLEERDLKLKQLNETLECVQAEKEALLSDQSVSAQSSAEEAEKRLSTITSLSTERDQLVMDLQAHVDKATETDVLLLSLQQELQEQQQKNCDLMEMSEQKESELEENILKLSQELQVVQEEKAAAESSSEEVEKLLSAVASLTAERDQLKEDLQENVEMMIENQEELRAALEKNREHVKKIKLLEAEKGQNRLPEDFSSQLEELQGKMRTLTEELESIRSERDALKLEKEASSQTPTEEMEKLLSRVSSLIEERDQLQETLEGLREEKKQLREELEDRILMVSQTRNKSDQVEMLNQELQTDQDKSAHLKQEAAETQTSSHFLEEELQQQLSQYSEMQRINHEERAQLEQQLSETKCLLQSLQEELETNLDLVKLYEQKESDYEQQMKSLNGELADARAERDALMLEKETKHQTPTEEMEKLQSRVSSLIEERDQLQETLEGLREEKKQLREELEDRIQMMQCDFLQQQQQLTSDPQLLTVEQETHQLQIEQLEEMLENAKEEMSCLKFDLQENVKLMTEKQEELQSSQERSRLLEEELTALKLQVAELESLQSSRNEAERTIQSLESKVQMLTEELESVRESVSKAHTEEMEKLQSRVSSLSEERDQLQEMLEGLREERKQLREELEDKMETLQAEMNQLNVSLKTLTEQNRQLEDDLQQRVEKVLSTQELLRDAQDELQEQMNEKSNLEKLHQEKESSLHQKISDLVKTLESAEAEKNSLQSEKETSRQTHTEELQEMLRRVSSLSEERDRLEGLREEKKRLGEELEDRIRMMSAVQEKLSQQEQWSMQQQTEREEREAELQHKVQQLEECLQIQAEQHTEADAYQQLLDEAKSTITALKQQLDSLEQSTKGEEIISSQLQDSTSHLQEAFGKYQEFIDACSKYNSTPLDKALRIQCSLKNSLLSSLPKAVLVTYGAVHQQGLMTVQNFLGIQELLWLQAISYRRLFEELVNKDLAIFEENRLQDLLLSRAHAPTHSIRDVDFRSVWEQRLCELLNKRQLYLQKMHSLLEKLQDNMASFLTEERAEICEREKFKERLERAISSQTFSFNKLECILSQEASRRSATAQTSKMSLQLIRNETVLDELKRLDSESESRFIEEKSKSSTLLQALEGAPLKTEVSLLRDIQQLVLQLQQAEENIKMLHEQMEELEETRTKANHSVSQHKEATQLLQTELQDTRALVQEKDDTIQTLKSKLRESEKKASPGTSELEQLNNKLFQMEVKLTSVSDQHKLEIQRLSLVLSEKEESLRKTKEALRRSQQQGDESFSQGEELHARLTNPRGVLIKSSIALEKTKLEERVQQLQLKITELESLASSQQAEISKWKNRAVKLKGKSKAEVDRTPPCTPTKRGYPTTPDPGDLINSPIKRVFVSSNKLLASPKKAFESPQKMSLLNSPKSRFFDMTESSDLLARNRPKQFFDNSKLGTIAAADVEDNVKQSWPDSPTKEEMCNTQ